MEAPFKRPRLALFVMGAVTGALVTSGDPGIDTLHRLQVTHSLWTSEPPVLPSAYPGFGMPGRGGTIHAWYGIGQSLVMLPADILATSALGAARVGEPLKTKVRIVLVCLLTFPAIAGLTLVSVFVALGRLGFAENVAALACLAMQYGTGHLAYTQSHQENSILMLLTAAGLALTVGGSGSSGAGRLILGMQVAASALLVRLTAMLDLGAVTVVAVMTRTQAASGQHRARAGFKVLAAATLGLLPWLLADRVYQWLRFRDITSTYIHLYGRQARSLNPALPEAYPFSTPFIEGFLGPFFSPQRSAFLLEPLLILGVVVALARRRQLPSAWKAIMAVLGCLLLTQVAFYAKYFDWSGAAAWGDRFITVPLHLLGTVGVAVVLSQWQAFGSTRRRLMAVVIGLAVTVQLASVALWYNLEEAQATFWHRPVVMPWQRFVNIAAAVLGRFQRWGLTYPGYTPRATRPNFLPFLVESYLPRSWYWVPEVLWCAAVVTLVIVLAHNCKALWRLDGGPRDLDP